MSRPPEAPPDFAPADREGSLEAPTRRPLAWRDAQFYDVEALERELERVYDICHGCRRCFSLCNAFPTLFDAVDASAGGEVAGIEKKVYWQVVDHCYLCDMCFMTKCPYVPPHPWNVDFPHLMLRAKAVRARTHGLTFRERALAATDSVGRIAGIPVIAELVNAVNRTAAGRVLLEKTLGVAVEAGYDLVAPIPSCVLMFKQELPLMYPEDAQVRAVAGRFYDPFEYLMARHQAGLLRTDFKAPLGKVSYHVPCHLRVQNLGLKTRDVLRLVPGTTVEAIERCSGHNGTYGVKREFRAASMRIGRPVVQRVESAAADHYSSDCPMAGEQIASGLAAARLPEHPLRLLRIAYGL